MPMESQQRLEASQPLSETRKTIDIALAMVMQDKAAQNPEEAREMFVRAFQKAEESVQEKNRRLNMASVQDMAGAQYNNKRVFVSSYKSHIVFLGEQGAIEVCLYPKIDESVPEEEFIRKHSEFTVILKKAGADGKHVWEA